MSRCVFFYLLVSLAAAEDDRPRRNIKDGSLQRAIHTAIGKGVLGLRRIQSEDGSWVYDAELPDRADATGGLTALALYALAASGLPANDIAIRRGLAWVKRHPRAFDARGAYGTYSASLLVLALARIDAKRNRAWIHALAGRLVHGQHPTRMWSYRLGRATKARRKESPNKKGGAGAARPARGDNSNSQFAVVALWAASSMANYRVPRQTWQRVWRYYATTQLAKGGWSYLPPARKTEEKAVARRQTPRMTAAGLVAFVYADAALHGGTRGLEDARTRPIARRGIDAYRRKLRLDPRDYYGLYAIERVGTVVDVALAEWYVEGARKLVRIQKDDGRWPYGAGPGGDRKAAYETSLALLFLSRATVYATTPGRPPKALPVTTRSGR